MELLTYALMTFRLILLEFLTFDLVVCGLVATFFVSNYIKMQYHLVDMYECKPDVVVLRLRHGTACVCSTTSRKLGICC